ncbi:peptide chain release factor aRF-1 [Nanoarchaeota archaeon]
MEEEERMKMEQFIEELESYKGRHTELITVYVPAGYNILLSAKQVDQEIGTASNIKSKSTRKNVIEGLERISRHLKLFKKTPKNGLAVFCGNISKVEGHPDIKIWSFEPPLPINMKTYRCDQKFVLDPIKELLEVNEVYALVVMDRREATLGVLEGKNIKKLKHMTSAVPGKIKAGGQSAQRFERITEGLALEFYRRIGTAMKNQFFEMPKLKGILVGGPGPTKESFLEEGQITTALKRKIMAVKDIGYTDEFGLHVLVEASQDILAEQEITKEKELMKKFFTALAKQPAKVVYGKAEVTKALENGMVEDLYLSKALKKEEAKAFRKMALATGAKSSLISTETEEGAQFNNLGGIGGILRFAIEMQ